MFEIFCIDPPPLILHQLLSFRRVFIFTCISIGRHSRVDPSFSFPNASMTFFSWWHHVHHLSSSSRRMRKRACALFLKPTSFHFSLSEFEEQSRRYCCTWRPFHWLSLLGDCTSEALHHHLVARSSHHYWCWRSCSISTYTRRRPLPHIISHPPANKNLPLPLKSLQSTSRFVIISIVSIIIFDKNLLWTTPCSSQRRQRRPADQAESASRWFRCTWKPKPKELPLLPRRRRSRPLTVRRTRGAPGEWLEVFPLVEFGAGASALPWDMRGIN